MAIWPQALQMELLWMLHLLLQGYDHLWICSALHLTLHFLHASRWWASPAHGGSLMQQMLMKRG